MSVVLTVILVTVGLVNFCPLIGVVSPEQIAALYGIETDSIDVLILLRHRAVLFGLLGAFIIYSAFKRAQRLLACVAGLGSMIAFIALAVATDGHGEAIHRVALIDAFATVAMLIVLIVELRSGTRGERIDPP